MVTFSLCMIVKNEEKVLARCLDSLADLMDEIIIVDTGSTDSTKEIAAHYTDKIFDFEWIDDFSAARNFSFSKASCDYIYTADADEVLDAANHRQLLLLKENLFPEIEIVQMHYLTPDQYNTTQNYADEYRPKLFKRLRTFTWINPVHETIRTLPLVFDSDVQILHLPQGLHSKRDFGIFEKNAGQLTPGLFSMYAKELFISGDEEDFVRSLPIIKEAFQNGLSEESLGEASCILARAYRLLGKEEEFLQTAEDAAQNHPCSEICCELGAYYADKGQKEKATSWYLAAMEKSEPCISLQCGTSIPRQALDALKR